MMTTGSGSTEYNTLDAPVKKRHSNPSVNDHQSGKSSGIGVGVGSIKNNRPLSLASSKKYHGGLASSSSIDNGKTNNYNNSRSSSGNWNEDLPSNYPLSNSNSSLKVMASGSSASASVVDDGNDSEWKVITSRRRKQQLNKNGNNSSSIIHNINHHSSSSSSGTLEALRNSSSASEKKKNRQGNGRQQFQNQPPSSNHRTGKKAENTESIFSVPVDFKDDSLLEESTSPAHTTFLLDLIQRISEELMFQSTQHPILMTKLIEFYQRELLVLQEISNTRGISVKGTTCHDAFIPEEFVQEAFAADDHHIISVLETIDSAESKKVKEESNFKEVSTVSENVESPALKEEEPLKSIAKPLWSDKIKELGSAAWTKESYQLKQAKAQQLRFKLRNEKAEKLRSISDKIKALSEKQEIMRVQAQKTIEEKLEKACKLRDQHLQDKKEKATRDVQPKLAERAQLASIETEIKKKSVLKRHEITKVRLQELEEERKRKLEENAAKEEAAMERRKALEAERIAKLQRVQNKEKTVEANRVLKKQEELALKEAHKEEKAKRLLALKSEQEAEQEEKRREITQKLEKGTRLHGAHIEQRKEKAAAVAERSREVKNSKEEIMTRVVVQDLIFPSFQSHLKKIKKNLKKYRQKFVGLSSPAFYDASLLQTSSIFYSCPTTDSSFVHLCREYKSNPKFFDESVLDSSFVEFTKQFQKKLIKARSEGKTMVCHPNDIVAMIDVLSLIDDNGHLKLSNSQVTAYWLKSAEYSKRHCFRLISKILLFLQACIATEHGLGFVLLAHVDVPALTLLQFLTRVLHYCTPLAFTHMQIASSLLYIISVCMNQLPNLAKLISSDRHIVFVETFYSAIFALDIVSFIHRTFLIIHGPLNSKSHCLLFVKNAVMFLETITRVSVEGLDSKPVWEPKLMKGNPLIDVIIATDLVGIITVLDSILLYNGPSRTVQADLSPEVIRISIFALKTLSHMARLNLEIFHECLRECSLQTELYHLIVFWLTYITSSKWKDGSDIDVLFQELVVLLGYACLKSPENGALLRFGSSPVILQLLSYMPFKYFNNPEFYHYLYPTLIISGYKDDANTNILADELHPLFLCKYLKKMIDAKDSAAAPSSQQRPFVVFENRFPKEEWQDALSYFSQYQMQ